MSISIAAVTCATEMVVTSSTNTTQSMPATSGSPPWEFGSVVNGFGITSGSITLTFRSPTPKTWRYSGTESNAAGTLVRGWQQFVFPTAPTITINGVPQTLVSVTVNGSDFWIIDGSGLDEGATFQTDACNDVVVVVSGSIGNISVGATRTLIQIEDLSP